MSKKVVRTVIREYDDDGKLVSEVVKTRTEKCEPETKPRQVGFCLPEKA